jgi:hypothetical protein
MPIFMNLFSSHCQSRLGGPVRMPTPPLQVVAGNCDSGETIFRAREMSA